MADVFISYAKTDRPLALKLAAMLEAEAGRCGGTQVSPSGMTRSVSGDGGRRSPDTRMLALEAWSKYGTEAGSCRVEKCYPPKRLKSGRRHETSPPQISASARGRCRAAGVI